MLHLGRPQPDQHGRHGFQPGAEDPSSYDYTPTSTTMTDPDGNWTTWNYDAFGRLLNEEDPFGTRSYQYDLNGNVIRMTDRDGRVTTYAYNGLNEKIQEQWLDGSTVLRTLSYAYDAAGNLTSTSDPSASYGFQYDSLNRPTSVTTTLPGLAPSVTLLSDYDNSGNRTQLAASLTDILTQAVTPDFLNAYTYDAFGHVTRLSQSQQSGSGANGVAPKQVGLTYNDAGQLTNLNRYSAPVADPTNPADPANTADPLATSAYGYDLAGRLTDLVHTPSGDPISYHWQYDNLNRLTDASSIDGTTHYTYDDTNQLTSASGAVSGSYTYDPNGNRIINGNNSTGAGNRLVNDGTYNYSYDAEGNEILRYDGSGHARAFSYDYRNRLTEVKDYTEATVSNGQYVSGTGAVALDVRYAYDTFNRLVSRTVLNASGVATEIDKSIYDGDHVIMDFVDPDGAGTAAPTLSKRFLYGPAVDQILAQEDVTVASVSDPSRVVWFLPDNQGTTRDVVDNTGTLVTNGHITYDAFGQVLTSGTLPTDLLYTGRYLDPLTGLQYNRARWYDSGTGTWISQDPIEEGRNWYEYVGNGPTNATDPTGTTITTGCKTLRQVFDDDLKKCEADNESCKMAAHDEYDAGRRDGKSPVECEKQLQRRLAACEAELRACRLRAERWNTVRRLLNCLNYTLIQ